MNELVLLFLVILCFLVWLQSTIMRKSNNQTNNSMEKLGQSTWNLLHSVAADLKPNNENNVHSLLKSLSYLYPCESCSIHMQKYLKEYPLQKKFSKQDLSAWLCKFHNHVNSKLGKKSFSCNFSTLKQKYTISKCGSDKCQIIR